MASKLKELIKVLSKYIPGEGAKEVARKLTKAEHFDMAKGYAKKARKAREEYRNALAAAIRKHGDRQPGESIISGVYREGFPENVKDELRSILREVSKNSDLAFAHYGATGKRTSWHKSELAKLARPDWSFY
jgi:hypothetical protein